MRGLIMVLGILGGAAVLAGCDGTSTVVEPGPIPAPPVNLDGWYYARSVTLTWELAPGWSNESFRVYAKRISDPDHFLIAEVTNCVQGGCTYSDINIVENVTYNYFVTAVNPNTGQETASEFSVDVEVPFFDPPPVPGAVEGVALDGAVYLRWDQSARAAQDFSFYRVYLVGQTTDFLLGETDSEGFLDELAENGVTYRYYVTSVDTQGHESLASQGANSTPRPDYDNEWIYAYQDLPSRSGFRFPESEDVDPLVDGDSASRHFRLEIDSQGWWIVPGPNAEIHQQGFLTTALKCGPGADFDCVDLTVAPATGYAPFDVNVVPQTTYVVRYSVGAGQYRYGALRVEMLGFDQSNAALMIFDWAHQLQLGNRNLSPLADG